MDHNASKVSNRKILFPAILLLTWFLLFGCVDQQGNFTPPYGTSQFINRTTDLNYLKFIAGDYNGMFLVIDNNKLSVMSLDINSYDINWSQLVSFPAGCGVNQAVKIVGSTLVCVDLPTDTNTQTVGWTSVSGVYLVDLNMGGKSVFGVRDLNGVNAYLTGKVGIGTTTPLNSLDVGSVNAGGNVGINATEGSEMAPALEAANWTTTGVGWSAGSGQLVSVGGGVGTIYPTGAFTVTAGRFYKVSYTVSASNTVPYFSIGGAGTRYVTVGTYNEYFLATSTSKIIFNTNTSGTCTITALSVKEITPSTGDLSVYGKLKLGTGIYSLSGNRVLAVDPTGAYFGINGNYSNSINLYVTGTIQASSSILTPKISNAAITSTLNFSAANEFTLGNSAADNSAVTQTIKGSVSTTNVAGSSLALQAGKGSGTIYGNVLLQPTSGKVGIGTTVPQNKLNVIGDINASGATGNIYADKNLYISQNSSLMGNVGIGTNSPSYKLDVNSGASIGIYVDSNVSAAGYITRTNVYDKSLGSALSKIKDASTYIKNGKIDHNAFDYSKVSYDKTVPDKIVTTKEDRNVLDKTITRYWDLNGKELTEKEATEPKDVNNPIEFTTTIEEIYKTIKVDVNTQTYKVIQEEGVSLDKELALIKQALFELKDCINKSKDFAEYKNCIK